jgi:hypothetical protein
VEYREWQRRGKKVMTRGRRSKNKERAKKVDKARPEFEI